MSLRLAAIDLGTVTSRLLVADVDENGITELRREARITHLGEGLATTGRIGSEALARELEACRDFLDLIDHVATRDTIAVRRISAVATSAMRDAANASAVLAALAAIGVDVEIITGEREAALSFAGTLSGFPEASFAGKTLLSVDVGGGSTEVVVGGGSTEALVGGTSTEVVVGGGSTEVVVGGNRMRSFDIGSRRMTERFFASDPPSASELAAARDWVREQIAPFFLDLSHDALLPDVMLAVAGTATSAVTVSREIDPYDPARVHGAHLSARELATLIERLAALPLAQRIEVRGLQAGRAPVILGGLIVLAEVLAASNLDTFIVSETDILHGILLDSYLRETAPSTGKPLSSSAPAPC
ncbi:MAG: hypothetical protein LBO07_06215 [Coriobacteriales bacterium]|jgi:exopolyphosphatase/guanosine-5'-triphosphate,3'-diphosphate pyrophosphatase|nr:hypothetical protein [Coriobacteriales bacterium]